MRRVSLVVTDVDGTLVTHDKVLTPRAMEAVERLHASGIAFSICSSRPPFGLRMMVEPLRLKLCRSAATTPARSSSRICRP
jgi:hydroxymethylpyrimidine pyrophosphatase-like HAD family hydrolase